MESVGTINGVEQLSHILEPQRTSLVADGFSSLSTMEDVNTMLVERYLHPTALEGIGVGDTLTEVFPSSYNELPQNIRVVVPSRLIVSDEEGRAPHPANNNNSHIRQFLHDTYPRVYSFVNGGPDVPMPKNVCVIIAYRYEGQTIALTVVAQRSVENNVIIRMSDGRFLPHQDEANDWIYLISDTNEVANKIYVPFTQRNGGTRDASPTIQPPSAILVDTDRSDGSEISPIAPSIWMPVSFIII